jgi:hypothetical protein
MRRYKYFLLFSLFTFQISFCQNKLIEKIQLSETILVKAIKNYIIKTKQNYDKFNTQGYIEVRTIYFNKEATTNKLKIKHLIKDQYYRPDGKKQIIPNYYCYIEGKLVLFYDVSLKMYLKLTYSKKKQRKLNRIIKPFLKKPIHLKIKDKSGNIIVNDKEFIDGEFNIHGGITLSIFNNKKFKIE